MQASELLKELISFKSITPNEAGCYGFITSFLPDFETISCGQDGVKNLFLYKKRGDGPHICFAGHIDVVPPGGGWDSDPFLPTERDGFIYGRGAADMKGGVAAFLSAARALEGFCGTLSILLTSDEEGEAKYGTALMLQRLKELDMLPDFCLVAEPTCEATFGDSIKVGRRGSINGKIKIIGRGGHAAYPQKADSPIVMLSNILPILANAELDPGDEFFEPSRFVITDIRGGYNKHNVIPSEVHLLFNVRNGVSTSVNSVREFVENAMSKAGIKRFELHLEQSSNPFILPDSAKSREYFETLSQIIERLCKIKPKASTAGGTSDARFMALYGIPVLEFGVQNETIHAPNERVRAADVDTLAQIFKEFAASFLK